MACSSRSSLRSKRKPWYISVFMQCTIDETHSSRCCAFVVSGRVCMFVARIIDAELGIDDSSGAKTNFT